MKRSYKKALYIASGMLVSLSMAFSAGAQQHNGGNGGGGGGGSRPASSTTSAPAARPSGGGGGVSYSRPPGSGNVGVSRPGMAPQRVNAQPQFNRPAGAVRGNYGFAPRTGTAVVPGGAMVRGGAGNFGYAPRTGVINRGGATYRTAPRIGYGNGGGYWGNHGYYHYNHGYYGSYYLPRIGFTCSVLPYGYYPFYWGDYQYFYSDGLYYQYENSVYTVVEPPIGAEVATLPDKAQSIVINGQQYYELDGVYYQPVTKDDGTVVYMIAGKDGELNTNDSSVQDSQPQGPQMGDIVVQLPQDCRKLKVNGQVLYVSPDGVYYQPLVDANGNKTYKIVGLPSDEPDQN